MGGSSPGTPADGAALSLASSLASSLAGVVALRELTAALRSATIVFVSAADPSTTTLISADGPALPLLERIGRSRLAGGGTDEFEPHIAVVEVGSPDGTLAGLVVAATADGRWSDAERALLQHAVDRLGDPSGAGADTTPAETGFEAALRAAAGNGELTLVYQPEVDLLSRRMLAVEALVRWQHPDYGELGPEWFISVAERSDLIRIVGHWVIDESIATLASWNRELPGHGVLLRVNVSPVQMAGEDIAAPIAAALAAHSVPGDQVCIELTENAPLSDPHAVADSLRRLRALGVTSAIDDLATGFSSLSHLRVLPVDSIKLDRSLVSDIDVDPRAQAIVTALVGLGLNFGLDVIAEGIEDEDEAATLLSLGCTRGQGHLFGRAVPAEQILDRLRAQRFGG